MNQAERIERLELTLAQVIHVVTNFDTAHQGWSDALYEFKTDVYAEQDEKRKKMGTES